MKNKQKNVRVDKWLWAARYYKTRQLAVKAIKNGRVFINGQRVKPASVIRIDDTLSISKGLYQTQVKVLLLSEQRGPASVAQTLYQETQQSIEERERLKEQFAAQPKVKIDRRKPEKRGVRDSLRFKRGE